MKKVIVIGDIHGRTIWKQIIDREHDADMFIFMGDYFDSFNVEYTTDHQLSNFHEICEAKRRMPERVILLYGNHDHHYLPYINEYYSGYQRLRAYDIGTAVQDAVKHRLLQMCITYENFILTHAGITDAWFGQTFTKSLSSCSMESISQLLNDLLLHRPREFNFLPGMYNDAYGDETSQTPIWVRPNSLRKNVMTDKRQIVGHTEVESITIYPDVILVDSLKSGNYLSIDGTALNIKNIFS
jgi:predicted phosphodiesterase